MRPSDLLAAFFAAGLLMLVAAGAAGIAHAITSDAHLHWLALHLALLGGVSQLVLGAGQFFVCAFLATTPPSRRVFGAQLAAWNTGILLVAIGVATGVTRLTDVGGILILAGLVLFAGALRAMQRRSLQRARWAVRWYQASAACLGVGGLIGVLLARGVAWPHGSLIGAHLAPAARRSWRSTSARRFSPRRSRCRWPHGSSRWPSCSSSPGSSSR